MEKKTFKDNPALQFISTPAEKENQSAPLEQGERIQKVSTSTPVPAGYKLNPLFVETKTKRLQLVLQPSLYERVKAKATAKGISVNEFIHRTLNEVIKSEEKGF